jgi:hypothetical protein
MIDIPFPHSFALHGAGEGHPFQGGAFLPAISPKKATARSGCIAAIVIPPQAGQSTQFENDQSKGLFWSNA